MFKGEQNEPHANCGIARRRTSVRRTILLCALPYRRHLSKRKEDTPEG